jgi:hypothetical protein
VSGSEFDPELLRGWGVRPADWNVAVSIQREILRGTHGSTAST